MTASHSGRRCRERKYVSRESKDVHGKNKSSMTASGRGRVNEYVTLDSSNNENSDDGDSAMYRDRGRRTEKSRQKYPTRSASSKRRKHGRHKSSRGDQGENATAEGRSPRRHKMRRPYSESVHFSRERKGGNRTAKSHKEVRFGQVGDSERPRPTLPTLKLGSYDGSTCMETFLSKYRNCCQYYE